MLRSYDNRVRQTARSPVLYWSWDAIKEGTKLVLKVRDVENDDRTMAFRDERYFQQSTLFRDDDKGGQIEVIAVPFIPGEHSCNSVAEMQALTLHMKMLHESGNVHGDIRALNIVFDHSTKNAVLIDFDFGGKAGTQKYPPGYNSVMDDGYRMGKKTEAITTEHDSNALAYVLGFLHRVPNESSRTICFTMYQLQTCKNLDDIEKHLKTLLNENAMIQCSEHLQRVLDRVKKTPNGKQTDEGAAISPLKKIQSQPKGVKRKSKESYSEE